jgi:DNA-binding GntR family transcriptional regulator
MTVDARTAEEVAAAVTADIRSGVLGNGAWLKQIDIEARYGCTRASARRALEALAIRGTAQRIPQRGYYVTAIDERERRELADVRVLLEAATAASIVERATNDDIRDLRRLARAFIAAVKRGGAAERYATNRAFHVRLTELCDNGALVKLVLTLRGDLPATPMMQWSTQAHIERSAREHIEMVEALAERDPERLAKCITRHIRPPNAG